MTSTMTPRSSRAKSARRGITAAVLGLLLAAPTVGVLPAVQSADAASSGNMGFGPGINRGSLELGTLTAFHNGETNVWCIEPRVNPVPAGGTWTSMGKKGPAYFSSKNIDPDTGQRADVSADALARANAAMYDYRHTNDAIDGAAMELYVWSQVAPLAMRFDGNADQRAQQLAIDRGGSNTDAIWRKYVELKSKYADVKAAPSVASSGSITVSKYDNNPLVGKVNVKLESAFAGGTVELTAKGGSFDTNNNGRWDESDPTKITIRDGQPVNVVPTHNQSGNITVAGKATSSKKYFEGALEVLAAKLDGQEAQKTGRWVEPHHLSAPMRASTPFPAQALVHPTVKTAVTEEAQYVNAGESITDQWTLTPDAKLPWPNGVNEYVLNGTLYGPFDEVPEATADGKAPEGAPVFDTFENVKVTKDNPTAKVTSKPVTDKGYYVFVANFDYDNQSQAAKDQLPDGYKFSDKFGLVDETALRIADITTKAQEEAIIDGTATDTVIVNGAVPENTTVRSTLRDNNATPGNTSDDKELGTTAEVAIEAGVYENAEFTLEPVAVGDPFEGIANGDRAAHDEAHSLYWQEELLINQRVEYTGDSELPNETTDVPHVEVTTKAQDAVSIYGYATDVATVKGMIAPNATLEFTAMFDNNTPGDTSDDVVVGEPVSIQLNTDSTEPVRMDGEEFTSPEVKFTTEGVSYWQERLYFGTHLVHEGESELPNETTNVEVPKVTTQADETAAVGTSFNDTAIIEGRIEEGTTLGFEAYQKVEVGLQKVTHEGELMWNEDGSPKVWTESEIESFGGADKTCTAQQIANIPPVPVEAGVHENLTIESETISTQLDAPVYWVESLYSKDGDLIHRGECGIENETTTVETPKVRTEATEQITLGESARDTAVVDGLVGDGYKVTFEAYYIPEGYDNSVNAPKTQAPEAPVAPEATPSSTVDPTATEVPPVAPEATSSSEDDGVEEPEATGDATAEATEAAEAVDAGSDPRVHTAACLDAELVYSSEDSPVALEPGMNESARYESPEFTPTKAGTYYWVETVIDEDGSVVHRGACGAEGETTKVVEPAQGAAGLTNTGSQSLAPMAMLAAFLTVCGGSFLAVKRRKSEVDA